ncbi:MAG: hypothetical protein ACLSVD_19590 [Eggerthellaceae bacterium]
MPISSASRSMPEDVPRHLRALQRAARQPGRRRLRQGALPPSELRTRRSSATLGGTLLTTIDGVRINADCRALNTDFRAHRGPVLRRRRSGSLFSGNYPDQMHGVACGAR